MKKQQKPLHRETLSVIWRAGNESLCFIGGALPIAFWLKYSVTHPYSQSMTDWLAELWHCAAGAVVWALKYPVVAVALPESIGYDIRTYLLFCTPLRAATEFVREKKYFLKVSTENLPCFCNVLLFSIVMWYINYINKKASTTLV